MSKKNGTKLIKEATEESLSLTNYRSIPHGLRLAAGMTEEEVIRVGQTLADFDKRNQFWIGDYLGDVESLYGSTYEQAISLFKRNYYRLAKYKYVAKRFDLETRQKFAALAFSHFEEVAAMNDDDAHWLLAMALKQEWAVEDLRSARRAYETLMYPLYGPENTERGRLREGEAPKDLKIRQETHTATVAELRKMKLKPILDKAIDGQLKPNDRVQIVVQVYMIEMEEDRPVTSGIKPKS